MNETVEWKNLSFIIYAQMIDLYPPVTARFSNYTFKKCSRVLSIGLWNLRAERSMKLYARKDGRSARFESPRKSEGGCFTTVARKKCQRKASQEHSERKKKKKKLRSLFKPGGRASPIEFRLFPLFFNFWLRNLSSEGKKLSSRRPLSTSAIRNLREKIRWEHKNSICCVQNK
jgi:hypothetical protein